MSQKKLLRARAGLLAGLDQGIAQASDPALCARSAPPVSKWSVKDHLEHLSIAHDGILKWIERVRDGDGEFEVDGAPNMFGRIVLLVGAFPRGRGKAPEHAWPAGAEAHEVAARLTAIKGRLERLGDSLPEIAASRARRNHFAFGDLTATQWLRFALIHHDHHEKIIRDVLAASSGSGATGGTS